MFRARLSLSISRTKRTFARLLRSNLISQKEDFPVFDMLFDCFWREQSYERVPMETMEIQGTPTESGAQEGGDEEGLEEAVAETVADGKRAAGKPRRVFRAYLQSARAA